ncbi:hypothetical protein jhhlp_003799 [Lomentospora prolificans]|uniref:Pop1 N-terminal domain-containing protein n=1 Tax=Lomentospora prolificans TaxID=41688 RepID=A0A2N3N9S1_9PEZI|nr:hypothetical protein jhhlp_003799 [Lomentospora prolificans]
MAPKPTIGTQNAAKRKDPTSTAPAGFSRRPDGENGPKNNRILPKRTKFLDARQIAAQPANDALKDGELDLQAFLAARQFEIDALEDSMRRTKEASSSRAFQRLPRALRRRTASHNPKRVPKRLRAKAIRESREDNTPIVVSRRRKPRTSRARIRLETAKRLGILAEKKRKRKEREAREKAKENSDAMEVDTTDQGPTKTAITTRPARPKLRRNALNDPLPVKSKFKKRQITKTWLPTHVWHAKRARMTEPKNPLWRFAVPLTPNEKTYRPTHRAQGESGAVMWDASYVSTIGLYGNASGIERVLKRLGIIDLNCWNEKGRRWRQGTRTWDGMLSTQNNALEPRRAICPAIVLWDPEAPGPEDQGQTKRMKRQRQVFIRVHPSAFLEIFNELLRLTKMETPRLYVEDLRFEVGSVEITGPASTEVLLGTLVPYARSPDEKEPHGKLFTALTGLTNPAALPANSVLGFSIQDPRLRYPPRTIDPPDAQTDEFLTTLATWPAEDGLQPYQLWNRDARHVGSCLPCKRAIDRRKSSKTPGAYLKATSADPPIPIILMAKRCGIGRQAQGTWILLAPWKCIQPLWYSLVHYPLYSGGNPRFGGLHEMQQVAFERDQPWFPADFVGTRSGVQWELEQREKRQTYWDRRPKGKRTAWESIELGAGRKGEVGNGLYCDFGLLFKMASDIEAQPSSPGDAMNVDQGVPIKAAEEKDNAHGLDGMIQLSRAQFYDLLKQSDASHAPPPKAVVQVRLTFINKGIATTCARIYRLPTRRRGDTSDPAVIVPATQLPPPRPGGDKDHLPADLREQWLALLPGGKKPGKAASPNAATPFPRGADLHTRKRWLAKSLVASPARFPPPVPNESDIAGHPLVPDAEDLVGFVTTGAFSLSEGKGIAIGSIAVDKVLGDLRSGNTREGTLCIVRNAGQNIGRLARWEVI